MNVLQFICPTGFYGAEMWILALAKNLNPEEVHCRLAITLESQDQNLELFHRFQALNLPADRFEMKGRFDVKVIGQLCRFIQDEKIDIIHTHGYKSDILGLIAAKKTGIKSISTPHGFENSSDKKLQLFIRMGCYSLKYFDRVSPLSKALAADMLKIKVPPKKIRMILNGVDLKEAEIELDTQNPLLYPDLKAKKIAYVGQMASRKNIRDLIKTFDLLYQNHPDTCLFLIGEGDQKAELEAYAQSLPSSRNITFLGYRADRLKILKEIDLFCMTSSLEGIPRCMMEAMAMGVPVAAYNIPGVDQLIVHEKTGLLADFGDHKTLTQCWERLLYDETFSKKIAQNGRQHILEHFSAQKMAQTYATLYQEMLN